MADCWDCMYSVMKGQVLKCKRKGTDVSERSSICSNFADSNAKCCDDCEYYEFGIFSRWNDHGKCKLTGQGRRDDDVACSRFIEGQGEIFMGLFDIFSDAKYSLQGTTQGNGLTGGVPPVRFSM